MNGKQFIQGDVMFVQLEGPLETQKMDFNRMAMVRLSPMIPVEGKHILARGEKTGHTHVADALAVQLFNIDGKMSVRVTEPTLITHDEHDALALEPGDYHVVMQRQYVAPTIEIKRAVFD